MEQPILITNPVNVENKDLTFSILLRFYCREFTNWSPYSGLPKYDPIVKNALEDSDSDLHLRIDFSTEEKEVYVPLVYYSATGNHLFKSKLIQRNRRNDEVKELDLYSFFKLAFKEGVKKYPEWQSIDIESGVESAIEALEETAQGYVRKEIYFSDLLLDHLPSSIHSYLQKHLDSFDISENVQVQLEDLFIIVGILGQKELMEEHLSLSYIYDQFSQKGEEFKAIFDQRKSKVKGVFFSHFASYDQLVNNVLHYAFFSSDLLLPQIKREVFSKYFEQEKVQISFRPFDLDRDLEMVHEWFHKEHAKTIWKMNWPLAELELFYRTLLPGRFSHSYIGEINGEAIFNFEIYWATNDVLGDYYDVLPSDYGTHLFIATTDKTKKFPALITRSIVEWMFSQPQVNRLVGEGSVESLAALMNKVHVGFKLQHVIEMPHKKAYLNFCIREWYLEKFPETIEIINTNHQINI
jgi:hypothetical protein